MKPTKSEFVARCEADRSWWGTLRELWFLGHLREPVLVCAGVFMIWLGGARLGAHDWVGWPNIATGVWWFIVVHQKPWQS